MYVCVYSYKCVCVSYIDYIYIYSTHLTIDICSHNKINIKCAH